MPDQFHVYGPTTIRWGTLNSEDLLGQSDGQTLITTRMVRPHVAITADESGGEPVDFIQAQPHMIVTATLIKWDRDIVRNIEAQLAAASTFSAPSKATWGEAGQVGKLVIADGGARSLVIQGTKKTAENGGLVLRFPRAFHDPDTPVEENEIGARAARKVLVFRCHPNSDGQFVIPTNIT